MIGMIVVGHGGFASGMESSLEFIAGEQPQAAFVNFDGDESRFHADVAAALESLSDCESVMFLCDLKGGTPFKYAATLAATSGKQIFVAYGVNLPSLIEISISRADGVAPRELLGEVFSSLSEQTGLFVPAGTSEDDE